MQAPAYFEEIKRSAEARWEQLEGDPELAAPWHQLFKQVQSPSHVVSELLQNADDAGATEAAAYIKDGVFFFEHNGEDFKPDHFASLCRFGYSNKRLLHTIGFRGIGFKSTFSLGDQVELYSPTLSVAFNKTRFTQPHWNGAKIATPGKTLVRVNIADEHRRNELLKNLEHWASSPISLLFFRSIRRLRVGDHRVHWQAKGDGPVGNTHWMALEDESEKKYLLVRSDPEPFPEDALEEIRQERMLTDEEFASFPPCAVELVLGAEGRLFVVLPTGVETELPFACNAPFIQDPARLKIKDPDISPTNRWLLQRAGELAATTMLIWLERTDLSEDERAGAYDLLSDVDQGSNNLNQTCGTLVETSLGEAISERKILLTADERLTPAEESVILPPRLFSVWSDQQVLALFGGDGMSTFSNVVSGENQQKLRHWGLVGHVSKDDVLEVLESRHVPKPRTWQQLLDLWEYVAPEITGYGRFASSRDLHIVPVKGREVLFPASEVIRIGEKKLLQSDEDWEFLSEYLLTLHSQWPRYLAERRRLADENDAEGLSEAVKAAYTVLREFQLADATDVSTMLERVSRIFFGNDEWVIDDGIRLAQIAAKLGAKVDDWFEYVTRDSKATICGKHVLYDRDGRLELLLPDTLQDEMLLHEQYTESWTSCSRDEFDAWVRSGRAGIGLFPALELARENIGGHAAITKHLKRLGYEKELKTNYYNPYFVVESWDFNDQLWEHWLTVAESDLSVWPEILEAIIAQPKSFWSDKVYTSVEEQARNGHTRTCERSAGLAAWILKFRELPCLRDTRGFQHKPADLLRRTPDTEPLLDVEPFVHRELDTEANTQLLKLLGVRDTATSPAQLLERLRALSRAENPPVHEVEKWYYRLDQLLENSSTEDFQTVVRAFQDEKLILTTDVDWVGATGAFLSADDEGLPGAPVVLESVRDLALWRNVGVADRPTLERVLDWLKQLPAETALEPEDLRRVRAFSASHPERIWHECRHWLSLTGEWTPVEKLKFSLAMHSLVPWSHLHKWAKQQTADLQRLPSDTLAASPFADLTPLAGQIEDRVGDDLFGAGEQATVPWIVRLGELLRRIQLEDEEEQTRIRANAARLAETGWQTVARLEVTPYISGVPAGTPRQSEAVWLDRTLYVLKTSAAKLAKVVPNEIGRAFGRHQDIVDAVKLSYDRSPAFVTAYVEENFDLAPAELLETDLQASTNDKTAAEAESRETQESYTDGQADRSDEESAPGSEQAEVIATQEDTEELVAESEAVTDSGGDAALEEPAEQPSAEPAAPSEPPEPSIMERFAHAQAFIADGPGRFYRDDGAVLEKTRLEVFPWVLRSKDGEILRHYRPMGKCLARVPVEVPAEVWSMLEQSGNTRALVLPDENSQAVEFLGADLVAMKNRGSLILYPATYRLVMDDEREYK